MNFLENIIEQDIKSGTLKNGIKTRFPPEPNGYLHIGHIKSICLNFGLADQYGGVCNLRLDDTNPSAEKEDYVKAIQDAIHWLGFNYKTYYASDYFDFMYKFAVALIKNQDAYIDWNSSEIIKENRGDLYHAGKESADRNRSVEGNLRLFNMMKNGHFQDGAMVLRAKIDMSHPNMNMRDPALYRIKNTTHHRTGNTWCVYPMYSFAHPIEDAVEGITHSICTLEFEDQRIFYDWVIEKLGNFKMIDNPPTHQYEFARLNISNLVTSKRKLLRLVEDKSVDGWDDPRLPTVFGLKRRGYTPESLKNFIYTTGVSKSNSLIDYSVLESCLRDDLEVKANRLFVILNPIKLIITNWKEIFGSDTHIEKCQLPILPHSDQMRTIGLGKEVWIDYSDYEEIPRKGYKRLFAGNRVRLKGGYIVECTGCTKDHNGKIISVQAILIEGTKSGSGSLVKAKAAIGWVGVQEGVPISVREFNHLFTNDNFDEVNTNSIITHSAIAEPDILLVKEEQQVQFERVGYCVKDEKLSQSNLIVFNMTAKLKEGFMNILGLT